VGIGFIGMTLRGTGDISPPAGVKGLHWADEAETANALAPKLRKQGVDVVALLLHQGGCATILPIPMAARGSMATSARFSTGSIPPSIW
jgi:hypothetical protein